MDIEPKAPASAFRREEALRIGLKWKVLYSGASWKLVLIAVPAGAAVFLMGWLPGRLVLTWYVHVLDAATVLVLALVAALAAIDVQVRGEKRSLAMVAAGVVGAGIWAVHFGSLPGVLPAGLGEPAARSNELLLLLGDFALPVMLLWVTTTSRGELASPGRALVRCVLLAAAAGVGGALAMIPLASALPPVWQGDHLTTLGVALALAALVPTSTALALLIAMGRPRAEIIPGVGAALLLLLLGSLSLFFVSSRHDGHWYAAHLLRFLPAFALLAGQVIRYRRAASAEREAGTTLGALVEELSASQSQLAEAQQLTGLGSWVWDLADGRVSWSEELGSIFGIGSARLNSSAERFLSRVHEEDREVVHSTLDRCLQTAGPITFEHRVVHPDGSVRTVNAVIKLVRDDAGSPLRIVGTGQDVTVRKRTEADLLTLSLEREEALRQHAERMQALDELKSEFLLVASHELRGPFSVINGYVALLQEGSLGPLPPAARDAMPVLNAKLRDINHVIEEMLQTARLETSALTLSPKPVDLRELAGHAVKVAKGLSGPEHLLSFQDWPDPVLVHADPERLLAAIGNLLDNAVKFSPQGGQIRCSVSAAAGHGLVAVQDDGLGIDREHMDRLFTRFGRIVTSANSHIAGAGLGLYIAQGFARMHQGVITVKSAPGRGSTFTLVIPVADLGG